MMPASAQDRFEALQAIRGETHGRYAVFVANDFRSENPSTRYAVKFLRKIGDDAARIRIQREIEVLSTASSEHLIKVEVSSKFEDRPWYATEMKRSFEDYWAEKRNQLASQPDELAEHSHKMILGVLAGLQALHDVKYVHRDIKPDNLVVDDRERPVLIDLGLVFRPEDRRITVEDGHPIKSRFLGIPPALYDLATEPSPAWDCMGVALLWGWMLAKDPRQALGTYHWRYHEFVNCEIADQVRAVMGQCAEIGTSPASAREMVGLVGKFVRQSPIGLPNAMNDNARIAKAGASVASANAAIALRKAEIRETATAAAAMIGVFSARVVAALDAAIRARSEAGMPLELLLGAAGNPSAEALFSAIVDYALQPTPRRAMWWIRGQRPDGKFVFIDFHIEFDSESPSHWALLPFNLVTESYVYQHPNQMMIWDRDLFLLSHGNARYFLFGRDSLVYPIHEHELANSWSINVEIRQWRSKKKAHALVKNLPRTPQQAGHARPARFLDSGETAEAIAGRAAAYLDQPEVWTT